jgi:hypothetical protein
MVDVHLTLLTSLSLLNKAVTEPATMITERWVEVGDVRELVALSTSQCNILSVSSWTSKSHVLVASEVDNVFAF